MTRKAGFVPVVLSRSKAKALVDWLDTIDINFFEPTILGSAGLTSTQIRVKSREKQHLIDDLRACLRPRSRGRPRAGLSRYMVPRDALRLIDRRIYSDGAPRQLRPVILRLIAAGTVRKGPKVSHYTRQGNIKNGYYPPETVRRYNWLERRAQAREALDRAALKASKRPSRDAILLLYPLLAASR